MKVKDFRHGYSELIDASRMPCCITDHPGPILLLMLPPNESCFAAPRSIRLMLLRTPITMGNTPISPNTLGGIEGHTSCGLGKRRSGNDRCRRRSWRHDWPRMYRRERRLRIHHSRWWRRRRWHRRRRRRRRRWRRLCAPMTMSRR